MTNEEIVKRQREYREHAAAVPVAVNSAKSVIEHFVSDPALPVEIPGHVLKTLVKEVERLQAAHKQALQDIRDEAREAQHSAASAYTEGRHDGLDEGRGW
jgi:flagellar biosynthesis/type III secretory pathway protein FliH